jgi:hypothetical protein
MYISWESRLGNLPRRDYLLELAGVSALLSVTGSRSSVPEYFCSVEELNAGDSASFDCAEFPGYPFDPDFPV